jgi:fucose permease
VPADAPQWPIRPRLVRDNPTLLLYALLAVWGFFNYGFGPVVALLRDEQHVSRGLASLHSTAFALGAVIGGLITPRLVGRLGRPTTMWWGVTGICAAIAGLCLLRPLPATLACAVLVALAGTLMLSGLVAGLSEHQGAAGPAAISEANAIACATGAAAPLVIGATVSAGWTWRPGLAVAAAMFVVVGLVAMLRGVRLPAARTVSDASRSQAPGRLPRAYWLAFTVMALCGSVEVSINLWAADLLRSRAGLSVADAASGVAAIVGGMFLGRLAGGWLALRFRARSLLFAALATSALGFAVFWAATTPAVALTGLVVCGLGNGLHFPLAISLALEASDGQPDLATARGSYAMAIAFGAAPFALGALADGIGVRWAFLLVPLLLGAAAVMTARLSPVPVAAVPVAAVPVAAVPVAAAPVTEVSAAASEGEPVRERDHDSLDPFVGEDHVVEGDDRLGPGVLARGVEDAAVA